MKHLNRLSSLVCLLMSLAAPAVRAAETSKPKIRAVTGFITIDAKSYPSQIEEAVKFLSRVRSGIEAAGYQVSGIRISTQPFPEYTRGLSHAEALSVLQGINDLAGKLKFAPNIGPAMLGDTVDAESVNLLIEVLSMPGNRLAANIVTAGDEGIHWNCRSASGAHNSWCGRAQPARPGKF